MLQLNPYASVLKKTAELGALRQKALKEAAAAIKAGKKPAANPLEKRAAALAKKGVKKTTKKPAKK